MATRFLVLLLSLSLLVGCASRPKQSVQQPSHAQNTQSWDNHQKALLSLENWEAQGRIAAAHKGQGGNASFVWQQEPDFYKIRMFGPFGAGGAELTGSSKQVVFVENSGKTQYAKTPEEIVIKSTGLVIPVRGLAYWIKGVPSPSEPVGNITLNAQGFLSHLEQSGWQVDFENYKQVGTTWLPSKLILKRTDMSVKLIVKKWRVK